MQELAQEISTSIGRILFNMLGTIAQFETEVRVERQADGIRKALDMGVKFGRRYLLNEKQTQDLKAKRKQGRTVSALMREYRISRVSVYNYLKRKSLATD